MKSKDYLDLLSGTDEVELTDELIKKIVADKKWKDVESLKKFAKEGARWNKKRQSLIIDFGNSLD